VVRLHRNASLAAQEQEFCTQKRPERRKSVTFLTAFAGFSAETAKNRLAKSRLAQPNGLARKEGSDRIMTEFPAWLAPHVPAPACHPGLAVAQLGSAQAFARGGFALASPAFGAGEALDPCFTAGEEDAVAPPLEWSAPPPGSQELVLVVEDASTKGSAPACHWLVWGLAAQRGKLLEGEVPPRTGKNAVGNSEWLLPDPPEGETRHYLFQLFATDLPLVLMPGAGRAELLASLQGTVTACAVLHATYTGGGDEDADWNDDDI
jgi:phosphatidylethanolamine-binding protein (PEBP) family uncharacterized protein